METWKMIEGYNDYQVSNYGRIKSTKFGRERILKQNDVNGYQQVNLCNRGKRYQFYIHQLVLDTFIGNDNPTLVINHRDFNPANNHIDNLEYVTQYSNIQHSKQEGNYANNGTKRLTVAELGGVRKMIVDGSPAHRIAERYSITPVHVYNIKSKMKSVFLLKSITVKIKNKLSTIFILLIIAAVIEGIVGGILHLILGDGMIFRLLIYLLSLLFAVGITVLIIEILTKY